MYVLDTNVLSEIMRVDPEGRVVEWIRATARDQLYTTAVTQAEVLFGIERMPSGRRKEALAYAAANIFSEEFRDRILAFDEVAARMFASLLGRRRRAGKAMSQFDAQIAAIVASRGATLVTRNIRDFSDLELAILDPWEGSRG